MNEDVCNHNLFSYEKANHNLLLICESKDIESLIKFADDIDRVWKQIKCSDYFNLMLNICSRLSSLDFGQYERQLTLLHKYVSLTLLKDIEIPLEIELKLLLFLPIGMVPSLHKGEQNAMDRTEMTKLWLRGLHRLHELLEPNFDFKDLPQRNIAPPHEAGARAGAAPAHIKDPNLRKEYEVALKENKKKAEIYNKQYKLKSLKKQFLPQMEHYIVKAYSSSASSLEELQELLSLYEINIEISTRILNAVKVR